MKTLCFKLYKAKRNRKLHRQINAAGLIYNHCIQNPETNDLRVREWTCSHCGAVHDWDRNAAKNILKAQASTFFGEAS